MDYDLIIIGGGPAGTGAGVYAARKRLKTLSITKEFGGQSTVSMDIQNWIGTVSISGTDLAMNLKNHLEAYKDSILDIKEGEKVTGIEKRENGFAVTTDKITYTGKTVLIATGSMRRKITVPGAEKFENKGITYCASCDGPLFSGRDVVVIGGGNAGFETAAQLLAYTKSVTLLDASETFRADPITIEKVLQNSKMKALNSVEILEVKGEAMVTMIVYKDKKTGEHVELPTGGIFVEIGQIPATEFVKGIVEMDKFGHAIIDPWTQKTNVPGIWAAGDCTNVLYHQNNIACGDAVRAVEDIYLTLTAK
ncbi:MAG: FAD-dependent oxidoreductase [bacterium]|nr:FAD-dependent oxidoreductase [bacterium]